MDIGASTYCFTRGEQIAHAVDRNIETTSQTAFFQRLVYIISLTSDLRAIQLIKNGYNWVVKFLVYSLYFKQTIFLWILKLEKNV